MTASRTLTDAQRLPAMSVRSLSRLTGSESEMCCGVRAATSCARLGGTAGCAARVADFRWPVGHSCQMWTQAGIGGDSEAQRDREMAWRRRQRPENEVPSSVALDAVLAGDHEVVVFISGARVFSNGVDFMLEVRARHASDDGQGDMLGDVYGQGGQSDRLLLGIEFSDGRRCSNIVGPLDLDGADSFERPLLTTGGGSGSTRFSETTLFLSPLPPPGDFRVVCAWPKRGLLETITVLSADHILDAAQRARVLWPWKPEPEPQWRAKPPAVPEGGWFAEQQAQTHEP